MPVGEVAGLASIFAPGRRYADCLTFLHPSYLIQNYF